MRVIVKQHLVQLSFIVQQHLVQICVIVKQHLVQIGRIDGPTEPLS